MGYNNKTLNIITNTNQKRVNLTHTITETLNINSNIDKYKKSREVELIAGKLVGELCNPNSFQYYCKIAWSLPENVIWNNLEAAKNAKNADPRKLFTWLCKRDMQNG